MALSRRRLTRYVFAGLYGAIVAVTVAGWWWDVVETESAAAVLFVAFGGAAVVGWIMVSEYRRAEQAQRWSNYLARIKVAAERDRARQEQARLWRAMQEPTDRLPSFVRGRLNRVDNDLAMSLMHDLEQDTGDVSSAARDLRA